MKVLHQARQYRQCFRVEAESDVEAFEILSKALRDFVKSERAGASTRIHACRLRGTNAATGFIMDSGPKDKDRKHATVQAGKLLQALKDKGYKHEPVPKDEDGKEEDITKADFGRAEAARQKSIVRGPPPDDILRRVRGGST